MVGRKRFDCGREVAGVAKIVEGGILKSRVAVAVVAAATTTTWIRGVLWFDT